MPRSTRVASAGPRIAARGVDAVSADRALRRAAAHELGNLLAAVRMTGHFVAEESSRRELRRMARNLELLSAHAAALTQFLRPVDAVVRVKQPPSRILSSARAALDGAIDPDGVKIASGRSLPEIRAEAGVVESLVVMLVAGAIVEGPAGARVRVTGRRDGQRVAIGIVDGGRPIGALPGASKRSFDETRGLRGRDLSLAIADASMRRQRGRIRLAKRTRGNEVQLLLPAVRARP